MIYGACISQGIPIAFKRYRKRKSTVYINSFDIDEIGNEDIQNEIDYYMNLFPDDDYFIIKRQNMKRISKGILLDYLITNNYPLIINDKPKRRFRIEDIPDNYLNKRIETFNGFYIYSLKEIMSEFSDYLEQKMNEVETDNKLYFIDISDFEYAYIFQPNNN